MFINIVLAENKKDSFNPCSDCLLNTDAVLAVDLGIDVVVNIEIVWGVAICAIFWANTSVFTVSFCRGKRFLSFAEEGVQG